jgi:hypothetical protein
LLADNPDYESEITPNIAQKELRRIGMIVEYGWLFVANKSRPLAKILKNTQWWSGWGRALKKMPGAERAPTKYYSPGINARGTKIPIALLELEDS